MNKQLYTLLIVALLGIFLVIAVYGTDNFTGSKTRTASTNPADAPRLSDLFPDRPQGPHQKFETEEKCLICHSKPTEIPGMGIAPQIAHEFRANCTSCHKLPRS